MYLPLRLGIVAIFVISMISARAAERTQTITLAPGWNSVWVEVEPRNADGTAARAEAAFAATPAVTAVARFEPSGTRVEYLQDPSAVALGAEGWGKWRRNSVVGEDTLGGIRGNSAYLIENGTDAPVTFQLTGEVAFHRYTWLPDSYHHFGVPISGTAPTFAEFFGPSASHPVGRIRKLVSGRWQAVGGTERMRKGEAYWVFCTGGSDYQGPVPYTVEGKSGVIDLGTETDRMEISAGNLATTPSSLRLILLAGGGPDLAPMATGAAVGTAGFAITSDGSGGGTIAALKTVSARFFARRPWTTAPPERESVFALEVGLSGGSGYFQYLPVRASVDVARTADPGAPRPGLWVGDVTLTQATTLVDGATETGARVSGARLEKVSRPLSYRVILHVGDSGTVSLLEHATIMAKTRVSSDLPREEVVVVNDSSIPGLVGIETRGGKLVGKRFDTAGYDLPRDPTPTVADEAKPNFDVSALSQNYLTTLPLDGTLSPGGVVTTRPNTLEMDPWHRTNPFRHVFNPEHRKGFRISREMRFEFGAGDPRDPGLLTGTFEERVKGLTKSGDTHISRGAFTLRRVSEATELQ